MSGRHHAEEVKRRLSDPRKVAAWLGFQGLQRQPRGVFVRCTAHADRRPSLSLTTEGGTLRAVCFAGCPEVTGDVFTLISWVYGLDVRRDFRQVLRIGAEQAGVWLDEDAPPRPEPRPRPVAPLAPPPEYPPLGEVGDVWHRAGPATEDPACLGWLKQRLGAPPPWLLERVDLYDLARAVPAGALPSWARCEGSWDRTHRLLVPVFSAAGELRSLRAIRTDGGQERKRVAPAGFSTVGLVMACPTGRDVLRQGRAGTPRDVAVLEGEPDWLTWGVQVSDSSDRPPALFGVVSSAWTRELADRVPDGSKVAIRTHLDEAGDRYAAAVVASFQGRNVRVLDHAARATREAS